VAHGRNKHQSRENRLRVRQLLLREWDPIGIYGDGPDDEYDAYAAKAYVMLLDDGATDVEIAGYLLKTATEHMGLAASERLKERCQRVAELLTGLRAEFQTH
jgi:hypothetical protein